MKQKQVKNRNHRVLGLFLLIFFITGCRLNLNEGKSFESESSLKSKEDSETSTSKESNHLESKLAQIFDCYKNQDVGIYVYPLSASAGKGYGLNEETLYYGAGIARLPIILYTVQDIKRGIYRLSDAFPYTEAVNDIPGAMVRGGSGNLQYEAVEGKKYTIADLLQRTILQYDNQATNMLGYYVADQNGVEFTEWIGHCYKREMTTFNKQMSARDAALVMAAIYNEAMVSDLLRGTEKDHEKLGTLNFAVMHLPSQTAEYNHDVGVVLMSRPYVISIMSKGLTNEEISTIAREINYVMELEGQSEKL